MESQLREKNYQKLYNTLLSEGVKESWMKGDWELDKKRFVQEQEDLLKAVEDIEIDGYDDNW